MDPRITAKKVRRRGDLAWTARSSSSPSTNERSPGHRPRIPRGRGPPFAPRSDSRETGVGNPRASAPIARMTRDGRASWRRRSPARGVTGVGAAIRVERLEGTRGRRNRWDRITGAVGHLSFADCETKHLAQRSRLQTPRVRRASMTGVLHVDCVGNPREPSRMDGVLQKEQAAFPRKRSIMREGCGRAVFHGTPQLRQEAAFGRCLSGRSRSTPDRLRAPATRCGRPHGRAQLVADAITRIEVLSDASSNRLLSSGLDVGGAIAKRKPAIRKGGDRRATASTPPA